MQADVPQAERAAAPAAGFAEFRRQIDALLDVHIPRGRPAALLQFPYDGNVGNHMMWIAATDYLEQRGIPLCYVAHANNFSATDLRHAIGDGPILFLGGVTISRLWPHHAAVKRTVAEQFRDNPLISLPATILFVDDADSREASDMFGSHPKVTLMARDPISEGQARRAFPPHVQVLTVPDLALRLPLQPRRGTPFRDIQWLARDDHEAAGFKPPSSVYVFDWPKLKGGMKTAYYGLRVSGVLSRLRSSRLSPAVAPLVNRPIAALYRQVSLEVLRRGNAILDTGKVLVTDRLHPHVQAALRGQDVVVLPDKFGKNNAVYQHYTRHLPGVFWADTPEQAYEIARERARLA